MARILVILLVLHSAIAFSQNSNKSREEVIWDQGIPFCPDDEYIVSLIESVDIIKLRDSKDHDLSAEEKGICIEIGLAFFAKGEYEVANWYFNRVLDWTARPIESKTSADREYVYLIKEVPVIVESPKSEENELVEMKKDLALLAGMPTSFENVSRSDLAKLREQIQSQIDRLIAEKDSLVEAKASKEKIESKDGAIKTLEKESQLIDLTIEKEDLTVEKKGLKIESQTLKKYLMWAIIGISLLILAIIVALQRKTIRVQDTEITKQLEDIIKKNTYLEHAAKIIRHDMHSGINTYLPRGVNSLEKRLDTETIENLKLSGPLTMIKEGLNHTQRVYKSVYEFTNLVKRKSLLEKSKVDLSFLINNFINATSYKNQVKVENLIEAEVNESLFCTAVDNLIRNGLKYNDSQNKEVYIYAEEKDLIFQDNGRGFSQTDFEKVLFSKDEESGLGLKIANAIFSEHGFSITFEKNRIGTRVKINLTKND